MSTMKTTTPMAIDETPTAQGGAKAEASKGERFLSLAPQVLQDAYSLYLSLSSSPKEGGVAERGQKDAQKEIAQAMADFASASAPGMPPAAAAKTAQALIRSFSDPSFAPSLSDSPSAPEGRKRAFVLESDLARFREYSLSDPHSTQELRLLLMSLLIQYRRNWHPKGWVHYDRGAIMHMAGLDAASARAKEGLTSYLHSEYGLEMQVIGSNNPIPCFRLAWAESQPESPSNPRVDLGPYSPPTTASAVAMAMSRGGRGDAKEERGKGDEVDEGDE